MANTNRYSKEIELLCAEGHWTAEQVHKAMKKTYRFIGIGTIYRNLNDLVTKGILMRHHGIGDAVIYENKNRFTDIFTAKIATLYRILICPGLILTVSSCPRIFVWMKFKSQLPEHIQALKAHIVKLCEKSLEIKGFGLHYENKKSDSKMRIYS